MINNTIKLILIIIILTSIAGATAVTTNAASAIGTDTVTFNANVAGMGGTGTLWYEYGGQGFLFRTANETISNGAQSHVVTDLPLIAGVSYNYRAVVDDGVSITTGNTVAFTMTAVSPIDTTDYNFTAHTQELIDANLNPVNVSQVVVKPYTDILGNIFWGIFFAMIFGFIWMKQEDITIPAMLGILIGATIWGMMDTTWVAMAQSMIVVSLAGLVYSLVRPPR